MPVFHENLNPNQIIHARKIFEQCAPCRTRNRIWCMRKEVALETRNKTYDEQKSIVEAQGDEVTPFLVRAIFDAVKILTSGTCPDNQNPLTFARTTDTAHIVIMLSISYWGIYP